MNPAQGDLQSNLVTSLGEQPGDCVNSWFAR